MPTDVWIRGHRRGQNPDVVLITPLVDLGSDQVEYVKAARARHPQCAVRAQLGQPDEQGADPRAAGPRLRLERGAEARSGDDARVKAEDVVVTGAPVYDQWFERRPSTTREEFCAQDRSLAGASRSSCTSVPRSSSRPTSPSSSPTGSAPCDRRRIRASEAGILIGRIPRTCSPGSGSTFSELQDVALWPRGGANPVDQGYEERLLRLDVSLGRCRRRSTPARRSSPGSSAARCSRSACPNTPARRKARCTSTTC